MGVDDPLSVGPRGSGHARRAGDPAAAGLGTLVFGGATGSDSAAQGHPPGRPFRCGAGRCR
eukprot:5445458-Alexandrium_andersonii.AAC.1